VSVKGRRYFFISSLLRTGYFSNKLERLLDTGEEEVSISEGEGLDSIRGGDIGEDVAGSGEGVEGSDEGVGGGGEGVVFFGISGILVVVLLS